MSRLNKTDILTEAQKLKYVGKLDQFLGKMSCEHNYVHTRKILGELGIDFDDIENFVEFCESNGGFCDCEIMLNVVYGEDIDFEE